MTRREAKARSNATLNQHDKKLFARAKQRRHPWKQWCQRRYWRTLRAEEKNRLKSFIRDPELIP